MGVLVGARELVTCSHVVNLALGVGLQAQEQPHGLVAVDFPLASEDQKDSPRRLAAVERWLPPPREGWSDGRDIAGLVLLDGSMPFGAVQAQLAFDAPRPGTAAQVFGYALTPPRPEGAWVPTTVRGRVGSGHLQLDSGPEAALRIQPGYSGSPVYDVGTGHVVGLVTSAGHSKAPGRDSYAVPSSALRKMWPGVFGPAVGPKADLDRMRESVKAGLEQSASWMEALAEIMPERSADLRTSIRMIESFRARALATLVNAALLGAFSSGKTLLASGLLGGLDYSPLETADGEIAPKYVGLLPSNPVPTNTCPARLVPVNDHATSDERSLLRVRFVDSDDWEDVGTSQQMQVLAAYVAQYGNRNDRKPDHRNREVAEIELTFAGSTLPATFYDLPGYGSPNPRHDEIALAAMNDADCFIYVAKATRSLAMEDLDLIRFLYKSHLISRRKVIWVLTALELVTELGPDNKPAWQATLEKNNMYLRENFTAHGRPDSDFIGPGFIPVAGEFIKRKEQLGEDVKRIISRIDSPDNERRRIAVAELERRCEDGKILLNRLQSMTFSS